MKTLIEAWNHNDLNKAVITGLIVLFLVFCNLATNGAKSPKPQPQPTITTAARAIQIPESTNTNQPALVRAEPSPSSEPSATFEPTFTVAPTVQVVNCPPAGPQQNGTVLDIIDGATLRVLIDGATYTVKYIGLQAPAKGQYYYAEAKQKNAEMVFAKKVILVSGDIDKDITGALPRYVLYNDTLVNEELLKQGCVSLDPEYSENPCLSSYQSAQQNAQLAQIGQWGAPPTFAANTIIQPTSAVVVPVVPIANTAPPSRSCCKHCGSTSQPCGNTCISLSKTCHTAPGCACN